MAKPMGMKPAVLLSFLAQTVPCPVVDCAVESVNCFMNPCDTARCPLYPDATCCSNFCGGCNFFFLGDDGSDVTARCQQNPDCPAATRQDTCVNGSETYTCRGDSDCTSSQVCCNNGCGTSCQDPVNRCATVRCAYPACLPGYTVVTPEGECCPVCRRTLTCPAPSSDTFFTSLPNNCPSTLCSNDTSCPPHQMCCPITNCGTSCVTPEIACTIENGTVITQGTTFSPDDCTSCMCRRDGTIACNRTCVRGCPDASDIDGGFGICAFICSNNTDCREGQYCCSNSCGGTTCINPAVMCMTSDGQSLEPGDTFMLRCNTCTCGQDGRISCTEEFCPERGCPPTRDIIPDDANCRFDNSSCPLTECPEGELCCPLYAGCAPSCVEPVVICRHRDGTNITTGQTYTPENQCQTCTCSDDGELMCERTSTPCCETEYGLLVHVGGEIPSSDCNTCTCTETGSMNATITCTERNCENFCRASNGTLVSVGETFPSLNGCNNCTCHARGMIGCTERFCIDRCYQPQRVGDCDAAISRYWFDASQGICTQFTWGGCEGNANNFESIEDCLSVCNERSTCLAPVYPNNEQPQCQIASQPMWTFNLDTGVCEMISYIPCQNSEGFNVYQTETECRRTCIGMDTSDSQCPPDVPIVFCISDPCSIDSCHNIPNTRCQANFCGGCNAWFFDHAGNNVTEQCFSGPTCDDGTPIVSCFSNPCDVSRCPNFPEATCQSDFCGGCNAWYFDENRNNVTDRCQASRPTLPSPLEFLQCPATADNLFGTCVESCSTHSDCDGDLLCCSNGCGHTCQPGDSIPYYEIPEMCPVSDVTSICLFDGNSCTSDDFCSEDGEMCCRSGCGRTCQETVRPTSPCLAVVNTINNALNLSAPMLLGVFTPRCLDDGSFAPTQCHGSVCWCVHTQSGQPTSPQVPIGTMPSCITCQTDDGRTYYPGQSFPHSDGCNTCVCSDNGAAACTRRACQQPTRCSARPDPGPCRGAFTAYYFDSQDGNCKRFTYGGCGGNDNKYTTVRDCMRSCRPDSQCLLQAAPGICEAYIPSYFFNITSNRCEQFVYGGCGGNDNNFPDGESCVSTCNPGGDFLDRCLGIQCDAPVCPPGSRFSSDGSCCGGTCSDIQCRDTERMCQDGSRCLSFDHFCDIIEDCDDGSDERDCPNPPSDCDNGFQCGSRECIPSDYVCDDYVDCRDRSDEQNCNNIPPNTQFIQDIPQQCPPLTDHLADCAEETCSANSDCDAEDELCCPTSCGSRMCTRALPALDRCSALRRTLAPLAAPSAFIPECAEDGTFSPVQCYNSSCWCVDIQSGFPLTEGSMERPTCGCQLSDDDPASMIPFGDTYQDQDGCNRCFCTPEWPRREVCTNDRCPVSCRLTSFNTEVQHMETFESDCIMCSCAFGSLNCTRKDCASPAPLRGLTQVRMPFGGDFNSIVSDSSSEDELKREVIRTLLSEYRDSLKLRQEQITSVSVESGSVIVIVELTDSVDTNSASLDVLLNQLEQDFGSGTIVIRFGNNVLQPTGNFQVSSATSTSSTFPDWAIAVIVVAAVLGVLAVVAIVVTVCVCLRASRSRQGPEYSGKASPNDYDNPVYMSYIKTNDTVKFPLD